MKEPILDFKDETIIKVSIPLLPTPNGNNGMKLILFSWF